MICLNCQNRIKTATLITHLFNTLIRGEPLNSNNYKPLQHSRLERFKFWLKMHQKLIEDQRSPDLLLGFMG